MPTLIQNYQKHVTVVRLKHFYSLMSQAFEMSRIDHGDYSTWEGNEFYSFACENDSSKCTSSTNGDGAKQLQWLEKYLLPYIKYTEVSSKGRYAIVGLPNGSGFTTYNEHIFFCVKFRDCQAKLETYNSRDRFIFLMPGPNVSKFSTYIGHDGKWDGSRDQLINGIGNSVHKCKRGYFGNCAALIQYDGWQIKDDYPW